MGKYSLQNHYVEEEEEKHIDVQNSTACVSRPYSLIYTAASEHRFKRGGPWSLRGLKRPQDAAGKRERAPEREREREMEG